MWSLDTVREGLAVLLVLSCHNVALAFFRDALKRQGDVPSLLLCSATISTVPYTVLGLSCHHNY